MEIAEIRRECDSIRCELGETQFQLDVAVNREHELRTKLDGGEFINVETAKKLKMELEARWNGERIQLEVNNEIDLAFHSNRTHNVPVGQNRRLRRANRSHAK